MQIFPDGSVFIQIANFIFLVIVLNLLLFKPIRSILKKRQEKVDGLEERIETAKNDAEAQDDAYLQGIKAARVKGLKEKEVLVAAAEAEEKALVQKINEQAQADLADVKAKIVKDTDAVRQTLQAEVDDFGAAIGERILGRAV
jgi:F-type H+-transporting ATPase subunit b